MADIVNVGTAPNAGNGDPLRGAMQKINNRFLQFEGNINLNQRFQGALATEPTMRLTGGPLQDGDWFLDSSLNKYKIRRAGGWVVTPDVMAEDLAGPAGPSLIGVLAPGAGALLISLQAWLRNRPLTPQEFGAIADGGVHPLSERYGSLGAAQAVYPFVTSLVDTIDWAAIQAALNQLATGRGGKIDFPAGRYCISKPLIAMPATLPAALTGSDVQFSEHVEFALEGQGDVKLIATAAMPYMLKLVYNASTDSIGPYFSRIENIGFDGVDLAVTAIDSDYTFSLAISKNKIRRVTNGINFTGYGVAKIRDNVIKARICINLAQGGGDSDLSSNDLYPAANGRAINVAKLGSNGSISKNVINGEGNAGCVGIYLDGTTALATDLIINTRIFDNEFSGMLYAIYGKRHAVGRNIFGIRVYANHTIPAAGGAVHTGNLINFEGVDDSFIGENFINGMSLAPTSTNEPGIQLYDCRRPSVLSNKGGNMRGPAIYMRDVVGGTFNSNVFQDFGQAGTGGAIIDVDTGCVDNSFVGNSLTRTNLGYAQESIYERAGANRNEMLRNRLRGCNRPALVGAASVVTGESMASGSYSLAGGVATLRPFSSGFTVVRNAAGVATITFATQQPDTNYRVHTQSDAAQVAVDTYATTGFVVRTFNSAGVPSDALFTNVDVVF